MRRLTKLFAVALVLTVVLVISVAGTAFAGNNPDGKGNGTQSQICSCDGECVCDGECLENEYSYNHQWSGEKEKGPNQEQQKNQQKGKPEPLPE